MIGPFLFYFYECKEQANMLHVNLTVECEDRASVTREHLRLVPSSRDDDGKRKMSKPEKQRQNYRNLYRSHIEINK